MRVLCFTPTHGRLLRKETVASVKAQDWAGELVHEIGRRNPYPGRDMRNVLVQYEHGRALALAGGYDALWTVEHDMEVPPDALSALWATGAPVAYGVYLLRHGVQVVNAWEYSGDRNLGESLSLRPARLRQALAQGVVRVSGVGFGCTLIRREVLARIPFRSGDEGTEAPDVPFAVDCLRANVLQVAHFGVLCGHWDGETWLRIGAQGQTTAVVARQTVVVSVDGESRRLVAGERYELPGELARELGRAGYVTPANS